MLVRRAVMDQEEERQRIMLELIRGARAMWPQGDGTRPTYQLLRGLVKPLPPDTLEHPEFPPFPMSP